MSITLPLQLCACLSNGFCADTDEKFRWGVGKLVKAKVRVGIELPTKYLEKVPEVGS